MWAPENWGKLGERSTPGNVSGYVGGWLKWPKG